MNRPLYLLFDFDGTIADSFALGMEILEELTPLYHLPHFTEEELLEFRGLHIPVIFKRLGISLFKIPIFLYDVKRLMQKRLNDLHPITGMCEALTSFNQQNIPMALLTSNAITNVVPFLERFNINYFAWFDCDISLLNKTHHLKTQIKRRNLREYNCIYIGDEIRDIKAAHDSGIKVISVSWGLQPRSLLQKHSPDYLINTPLELQNLVTSL